MVWKSLFTSGSRDISCFWKLVAKGNHEGLRTDFYPLPWKAPRTSSPLSSLLLSFLNHGRWNNHSFTVKMYVSDKEQKSLVGLISAPHSGVILWTQANSLISSCCRCLVLSGVQHMTPWNAATRLLHPMGFRRQASWNGFAHSTSKGIFLTQKVEPRLFFNSSLLLSYTWKPLISLGLSKEKDT